MSILFYWFIHRLDFMLSCYYEQFLTPLKLWMTTTWIAAGTTGESSGASAIAKNAIEVWNLSLQRLFLQHPRRSSLNVSRPKQRPLQSSCEVGFSLIWQHYCNIT